jgi:hypothetical protein
VSHTPPAAFLPGDPISISLDVGAVARATSVEAVRLRYRHVDQSKTYGEIAMIRRSDRFEATIPGAYTDSPYAIQYLFAAREAEGRTWLYPGLGARLSDQPYCVVRAGR